MTRALLSVFACFLCLAPQPCDAQNSQFKGWTAVSKELSVRIAPKDSPLDMNQFIPAEDMDELLGTWFAFGTEHNFQNGSPNSLNMVIWRVALSGFAKSVGATCESPRLKFHPRFLATLRRLCTWPSAEAKADPVLLDFWLGVMGYNAPDEEFTAWRDMFLHSSYQNRPAAETIEAMTLAITMNPHFLLHK
jgi:hypothetical protein